MTDQASFRQLEDLEIELLLEGVYRHYGYDFRSYAPSSLRRRIRGRVLAEGVRTVSGLKEKVLHEPECMERFLRALSINVSTMFRDPSFFRSFRENVVPVLRTYPFIRVWHAGCSTGEEAYSLAILLIEEGLYERSRLYATDMNNAVITTSSNGIYSMDAINQFEANYIEAGGKSTLSDYYTSSYGSAIFHRGVKKNIIFAQHNLASDGVFNEFNVIMCRNVLIYFNEDLQSRVFNIFSESLVRKGFLCLGMKESLRYSGFEHLYSDYDGPNKIFRGCN